MEAKVNSLVPVCVWHDGCPDGALAAWIVQQAMPTVDLYPGKYNVPPDLKRLRGRDVVIVDFSWKAEAMADVIRVAASVTWLDHHKTAVEEYARLIGDAGIIGSAQLSKLATVLDMERSGAGITWDHFNPGQPRPQIVDVAEDRDLFRFKFPETKALHAWMSSYPLAIENRGWLAAQIENWPNAARETGDAILRYHDELVAQAAEHYRLVWVGPHIVPSVTCPCVSLVSDLGHRLLQKVPTAPFAAVLMPKSDGSTYVSLRSEDARQDVSAVAATFGGGGHRNAAGCTLKAGQSFSAAP